MSNSTKATAKRNKKVDPTSKEALLASATAIQKAEGIGFVKAMIRARKAAGLVPANLGKERLSKKAQAALAAQAATA